MQWVVTETLQQSDRLCRNFIFKRHFPIRKLFERSCELGLWRLTADKIGEIFGMRVSRLKGHGLLQRDGSRYAYRLTPKGVQVALLFLFFHKRLCGPLANSRFHHRPDTTHQPASKLEAAYHRADNAIQQIVDLLAA